LSWATNEFFDARAAVKRGPFSLDWIRGVDAAADFFSRDIEGARSGEAGGKKLPHGAAPARACRQECATGASECRTPAG